MRTLIYILMGIFTFLIQADVLPVLFRQGWIPNLILVWVIVLSLLKGRRIGLMAAITGGLVHDILISNAFGLHLFPYIAVAYIVSIWSFSVYEEQWYITFAWVSVGTLADIISHSHAVAGPRRYYDRFVFMASYMAGLVVKRTVGHYDSRTFVEYGREGRIYLVVM